MWLILLGRFLRGLVTLPPRALLPVMAPKSRNPLIPNCTQSAALFGAALLVEIFAFLIWLRECSLASEREAD